MEFNFLGCLFVALFIYFTGIKCEDEVPFELDAEMFKGVEERFSSLLSDDLREKLLKNNHTGLDVGNLEEKGFTESERKQIEEALIKSFQPLFTEFAQEVVKAAIASNVTETKAPNKDEIEGKISDKGEDGKEKKADDKGEQKKDEEMKEKTQHKEKESKTNGFSGGDAEAKLKADRVNKEKKDKKSKLKEEL